MRLFERWIYALLVVFAFAAVNCGSSQVVNDPRDIQYPSSVEQQDAQAAINDAQQSYNALGEDGTAETGEAKRYLNKAKQYLAEGEYEAAWSNAIKAKSYCALSAQLQITRKAGLK